MFLEHRSKLRLAFKERGFIGLLYAEINDQSQLPHHIELSTFFKKSKISDRREKRKSSIIEGDLLPPYRAIQQKNPQVSIYYRSRDIRPTLTVSFNLKWILVTQ